MLKRIRNLVTILKVFKPLRTLIRRKQMVQYPQTLPLDCISTLASIVKSRQVAVRKQEFGICAWNVQGYLQNTLLGSPLVSASGPPEVSEEQETEFDNLYNACGEYNDHAFAALPEEVTGIVDPMTVIAILSSIMQLIEMFKNRKNK